MELKKIAVIRNGFKDKFGIPRQSGIVDEVISEIVFEKEFRNDESLRGIDGYSHLWLLWLFSENQKDDDGKEKSGTFSPTVRPPRLGGNKRMGVFATRSPFRPNMIGLSSVRFVGTKYTADTGTVLMVAGADLKDGTPLIDIKPYIKYTDSHPDAVSGFADACSSYRIDVICGDELLEKVRNEDRDTIINLIACDPRPSYQNDPERIYKMDYGGYNISFKVGGTSAEVINIERSEESK